MSDPSMFGCCCCCCCCYCCCTSPCLCNCDWFCANALWGIGTDDNSINDIDNINTDKKRNDGHPDKVDVIPFTLFFDTLVLLILSISTNRNNKSTKKNTYYQLLLV